MEFSERISSLPPYLFAELDRKKQLLREQGVEIIDLGVGDPDIPTPEAIINKLREAAADPSNHCYPSYEGLKEFREEVARWYKRRFHVELNPEREVMALIGSKEGIAHLPLAFVNPGDYCLVPDPSYPVYRVGSLFAGGRPYFMPLREERGFLPDLREIPSEVAQRAKLLFINYPNNPTAAVATEGFFQEVVEFAKEFDLLVCHDAAYSELYFDTPPLSFLQVEGAKEVGVEFHSLSKSYRMTGWRLGMVVGNPRGVEGLGKVKTNVDSGVFQAIQWAGVEALRRDEEVERTREVFRRRRDLMVEGLRSLGFSLSPPSATFYLWFRVPKGYTSASFAELVLTEAGVVVTPGNGFGEAGEGYIRLALTVSEEKLKEALERLKRLPL